jgi:hypothetical protein
VVSVFVPDAPALGRPNEYTQDRTVGRDWDDDPRASFYLSLTILTLLD